MMSKPRPKIEIVSAQPMSKIGEVDFTSGVTSPPRLPPTVIRLNTNSSGSPPVRPAASITSTDSPSASDRALDKDVNENAVPNLPLKTKANVAAKPDDSSFAVTSTTASSAVAGTTLNRKQPPPRPSGLPSGLPKVPTRAKKLAKQQRGDSPVENASRLEGRDSPVGNDAPVATDSPADNDSAGPKSVKVAGNETVNDRTILRTSRDDFDDSRSSSIPQERTPPPPPSVPSPSASLPPPVPPHSDDYDPDTYEYMEPIDSLHRPPHSNANKDAAPGYSGVATEWKPISSSVGGPDGEGLGSSSPGGGPPKPRRSFKRDEKKQEPTRFV